MSEVRREAARVIPASRRPDGSMRKEIRVRPGFTPQGEVGKYVAPHRRNNNKCNGLKKNGHDSMKDITPPPPPPHQQKLKSEKNEHNQKQMNNQQHPSTAKSCEKIKVQSSPHSTVEELIDVLGDINISEEGEKEEVIEDRAELLRHQISELDSDINEKIALRKLLWEQLQELEK